MDLDLFQDFNTRYGHPAGNGMLQNISSLIKQNVREVDMAARYGGEEFILLLPMIDGNGASALAERLREQVEHQTWENPSFGKLHVTISCGVASIPAQVIETAESLLACADKALRRAKANGRNRMEIYEPGRD